MTDVRRVFVVVLLGILLPGAPACGGDQESEGINAHVRDLLPEAASMNRRILDTVVDLGAKFGPSDFERYPSLPMLVMTAFRAGAWPPGVNEECRSSALLTPKSLQSTMIGNAWSREHAGRPTILSPEVIQSVTVQQTGDVVQGVVAYRAEGVIEGTVHYEARRLKGEWRITAFDFPVRGVRIVREDGAWKVDRFDRLGPIVQLAHGHRVESPPPRQDQVAFQITPYGDVCQGRHVWALAVANQEAQAKALKTLEEWLRELVRTRREEAESAPLEAVIVADAAARWRYATYVVRVCRSVGIGSVWLAARSMADDRVGVLRAYERESAESGVSIGEAQAAPRVVVKLFRKSAQDRERAWTRVRIDEDLNFDLPMGWKGREGAESREPYDRVIGQIREGITKKAKAARQARADGIFSGEIVMPPPFGVLVPYEDVVQMIDLLREAGAEEVVFVDPSLSADDLEDTEGE